MAAKSNIPAMFRPFARYVEFNGRSNRAEFWLFLLFIYAVEGALIAFIFAQSMNAGQVDWERFFFAYIRFGPLLSLFGLAIILPVLAVRVRRLHDINRSGWWILVPMVVSMLAYLVFFTVEGEAFFRTLMQVGEKVGTMDEQALVSPVEILKLELPLFQLMLPWVMIPTLVAELIMWVVFALPGTKGDNRFGPTPAKG